MKYSFSVGKICFAWYSICPCEPQLTKLTKKSKFDSLLNATAWYIWTTCKQLKTLSPSVLGFPPCKSCSLNSLGESWNQAYFGCGDNFLKKYINDTTRRENRYCQVICQFKDKHCTPKEVFITSVFNKYDQVHRKLQIRPHLLKNSL